MVVLVVVLINVVGKGGKPKYEEGWTTQEDGSIVWQSSDGTLAIKGGLQEVNGQTYYLDSSTGARKTGLVTDKDNDYYFDPATGTKTSGFVDIDGVTCYFSPETGARVKDGLQTIDGKQYYFDETGALLKNKRLFEVDGQRKCIDENGVIQELTRAQQLACQRLDEVGWELDKAFEWVIPMDYVDIDENVPEGMKATEYFAEIGLENLYGTCYCAAAAFYMLAYMLDYDAHFIMGYVANDGGYGDHGWCEIDEEDGTWVYDTTLGYNGWRFQYGAENTRDYMMYERVE